LTTGNEPLISRWEHEAVLETVQASLDQWWFTSGTPVRHHQEHRDRAECARLQHEALMAIIGVVALLEALET
jgi:hypothetical protein